MKNKFTADGPIRLLEAQLARREKAIQEKYADNLATAGPLKKLKLHARMMAESLAGSAHPKPKGPSAKALW